MADNSEKLTEAPKEKSTPRRIAVGCGSLFAISLFVGVISAIIGGGSSKQAASEMPALATIDPTIKNVELAGDQLWIMATLPEPMSDLDTFIAAGALLKKVGRNLQHGVREFRPTTKDVHFKIRVEGQDRLGNKGDAGYVTLNVSADDMRHAKFDNIDDISALDLATPTDLGHPLVDNGIIALCGDENHESEFCHQILLGLPQS